MELARAAITGEDAAAAFARRDEPGAALADRADALARTCEAMAGRFRRGGTLLAFGNGGPSTDAQHVSVEFVHPVIVGKRALPALSLATDAASVLGIARRAGMDEVFAHQLRVLARDEDVALGISPDGRCDNVLRGLEVAQAAGLLTVALVGDDGGPIADSPAVDHALLAPATDPHLVKELHVTTYHILWELVHVFLEQPEADSDAGESGDGGAEESGDEGLAELYPFLYEGVSNRTGLLEEVADSSAAKAREIVVLRREVSAAAGDAVAGCATELTRRFAAGGKLLAFGNGGSSSDAQQVVASFLDPAHPWMRPLPALGLTNDIAVITALANDVDFDVVFSRQIAALGEPTDIALGLSTSGNSPNVIRAFEAAKERGLCTVGLAGGDGGAMAASEAIDHLFVVPSASVHRIQETQTTLYHVLRELTAAGLGQRPPQPGPG